MLLMKSAPRAGSAQVCHCAAIDIDIVAATDPARWPFIRRRMERARGRPGGDGGEVTLFQLPNDVWGLRGWAQAAGRIPG